MPKHAIPATGEAMPVVKMNRRAVMTGTAATAAALAVGLPVAAAAAPSAEQLMAELRNLPPMKRLFMVQRLHEVFRGEPGHILERDWTPEEAREAYDEWLSGFTPCVIAAFESGKWEVRI